MEEQLMERVDRLTVLIIKYLKKELTMPEQSELNAWHEENEDNAAFFNGITDPEAVQGMLMRFYEIDKTKENALQKILSRLTATNSHCTSDT